MTERPRNIANDMVDMIEKATAKWTKQKKSEDRHPGNIRYRVSRMTKVPRTTQKDAVWELLEKAYLRASGNGTLPALARQVFYQIRPPVMAMTDDKELAYNYFSQTLLPDYIDEHGVNWDIVFDARGHFEECHTNRRIGCGTIEVDNYLAALKDPTINRADFADAYVSREHRRCPVLRKGRIQSALQGGQFGQPLRPDDHLYQRGERPRSKEVGRLHLRRVRPAVIRAARL